MAKWSTNSETGILRKPVPKDKFEDLLVFGYACKIFRDDEKALFIDKGKHLIPWMGDGTLKIDRYDCRGALSELRACEGSDHDASRWLGLSESDRRIELLCDEERYYALKYNEEELEMYQEEEIKRLQQKGTEFQYNYDVPRNPEPSEYTVEFKDQDEEFVPAHELSIPADMEVPKTVKENARIEKTATFVSNQGPQMEILIKTKQADNPQFNFMNKENPLYKYYKHLLTAIKSGQYKVQPDTTTEEVDDNNEHEEHDGHYLHPSLVAPPSQPAQPPPPPLPTVTYKPSADCAYSQLVSRIQGTQSESATPPPPLPAQEVPQSQMTLEQQQYYQQYYYAAQYYEYYKQMALQLTGQNAGESQNMLQDAGFTPEQFYAFCQNQTELQSILQSHAAYQQYIQTQEQQPPNPYAQLVSNLSQSQVTAPSLPNLNDISKAPILYTKSEEPEPQISTAIIGPQLPPPQQEPEISIKTEDSTVQLPLLSLAQYGSDSEEDEESEEESDIKTPPKDLQQIIDKMAIYVSKNGKDFEAIVKAKGDPRFHFLNADHEYNRYYKMKLSENSDEGIQENGVVDKPKEKKVIAPVSFSIKKPKEELPKEIKSALPIEESDDEHENNNTTATASTTVKTPPVQVTPPREPTPPHSLTPPLKEAPVTPAPTQENGESESIPPDTTVSTGVQVDTEDLILEMIDITDDLEERRESKRVENSKKDKITAAVRERLALQLERKKKAAAFLKLQSNVPPETVTKTEKSKPLAANVTSKSKSGGNPHLETSSSKHENPTKSKTTKDNRGLVPKRSGMSHKTTEPSEMKTTKENTAKEINIPKEVIVDEIISIEDSDLEEGEIKKHKKSVKKKKSHKRKHSKSHHESKKCRHRHKSKEHKKSKKRRKKSETYSSDSSESSS